MSDINIEDLLPEEQHQLAYETWVDNGYPKMSKLCSLLQFSKNRRFDLQTWMDGSISCSCQWHLWVYLEAERRRLFELGEATTSFSALQEQKSEVFEAVNVRKRDNIRLVQLVLDSVVPYITGKKAVTEDGELITIQRIQPRCWKDLIDTIEKMTKIKQLLLGAPTDRTEVMPAIPNRDFKELQDSSKFKEYLQGQNEEFLKLVSDIE